MFEFLGEGLFWILFVVIFIVALFQGFFSISRGSAQTAISYILIGIGVLNLVLYVTAFFTLGLVSAICLFLVTMMVGGISAAEFKVRLFG